MPIQFEAEINYLGQPMTVKTDNLEELHQALAGISEMNVQYRTLAKFLINERGMDKKRAAKTVVPGYRVTKEDGYEYYDVKCDSERVSISFGKHSEKRLIPFFPKREVKDWDKVSKGSAGAQPPPQQPQQEPDTQQADYVDDGALPF